MTRICTIFGAYFAKLSVSEGYTAQCQWYTNTNTEHWWNSKNINRNDSFIRTAVSPAPANNAIKKR